MGGTSSRPETSGFKGCWKRKRIEKDEVYVKTGCKRNSAHLRRIEVDRACVWEEVPTPNSEKMYLNYEDGNGEDLLPMGNGMNYEKLMQIIRCFPFPSPRNSPRSSPRLQKKRRDREKEQQRERSKTEGQETDCCFLEPNAMEHAFGRLVQVGENRNMI
ncbi:unnamed protein product, partial [Mesorhabditis belari]|uniref:Uncharacterized protein n=1 Tax=Mesorhabditis belari TaxID=2138241 RepID=A0AAF3F3I7_9BILA